MYRRHRKHRPCARPRAVLYTLHTFKECFLYAFCFLPRLAPAAAVAALAAAQLRRVNKLI